MCLWDNIFNCKLRGIFTAGKFKIFLILVNAVDIKKQNKDEINKSNVSSADFSKKLIWRIKKLIK